MHIWVDADACPHAIKDLLFRAAKRLRIALTLVANQPLRTPPSPYINVLRVSAGFDVADHTIVQHVRAGDLVVTADIPLAAQVVARGARAQSPRPVVYPREHPRTPDDAPCHGRAPPERCRHRWAVALQPARPASVCQSIGSLIDAMRQSGIRRHKVSAEHAAHQALIDAGDASDRPDEQGEE